MKWEMGILSPSTNWFLEETRSTKWTSAENKIFENALAVYDKDTPDRWQKVAAMIPGKTVGDVIKQYRELEADVSCIEAGLVPVPGYTTSHFTLDWASSHAYDGLKHSYGLSGKRSSTGRPAEQERKKGIPWTEEEHKLFLMGLKKYGKGDWRNISRNFVVTRTPTQVASHAQKYFIRQLSGGKDKRRASIHDITTVNLNDAESPSPDNKGAPSPDQPSVLSHQPDSAAVPGTHFRWNQPCGGATMAFNSTRGNTLMSSTYGIPSYGSLHRSAAHESYFGPQNLVFRTQPAQQFPHG